MDSQILTYRNSAIGFRKWGNGKDWLFCFHGYGEESTSFAPFAAALTDRFTMVAIDMPFHGTTDWREGLLFTPQDLVAIIQLIKPIDHPLFIFGYSMGGRMALSLISLIPQEISGGVLVAPDGWHRNKWQWLATQTLLGNLLFKQIMKQPKGMLWLVNKAHQIGWFNNSIHKFIYSYLADKEQRLILYKRWTTMRRFTRANWLIVEKILAHHISLQLVFGKYDKIIVAKHANKYFKKAAPYLKIIELPAGHQLLREKYVHLISKLFVEK